MLFVRLAIAVAFLGPIFVEPHVEGAATIQGPYVIGDRIEWNVGGILYKGTVYNVQDGRYQIERDGYGRTTDWVSAADLRRLPGAVVAPAKPVAEAPPAPRPAPAAAAPAPFKIGDRVIWNVGGIPFEGTIFNAEGGRFQVDRDGYGRTNDWVTPADLRLIAGAGVAAAVQPRPNVPVAPVQQPAPLPVQPQPALAAAAPAPFKIGDRVIWNVGGIPFEGTIFNAEGGRFQVDRDGYGRTNDWVPPADLRLIAGAGVAAAVQPRPNVPAAPVQQPAPLPVQPQPVQAAAAPAPFKVGDRVIWNVGGIPFEGTIFNADGGRFQVDRDGYGRTNDWVTPADLRLIAGAGVAAAVQPRPNVPAAPVQQPAPLPVQPQPAPGPGGPAPALFKIGDRVDWQVGDIWYTGIIFNEQVGNYQVNRDQYGRAREWTTAANLRPFVPKKMEVLMIGVAGRVAPFKRGERVEVAINGVWCRGNVGIADIDNDRYVVDRDNLKGEELVTGAQLRRLVYAP